MNFNHQDFKCSVGNNTQLITRRLEFKRVAIRFFDEGQKLVTSALNTLYGGQFTFDKIKWSLYIPPPHHSFFRNLPPLFICDFFILGYLQIRQAQTER